MVQEKAAAAAAKDKAAEEPKKKQVHAMLSLPLSAQLLQHSIQQHSITSTVLPAPNQQAC